VTLGIVVEESNGAVAVPDVQRLGLVLALPVGELDLQDSVAGRNRQRGERVGVRLLQLERPSLRALGEQARQPREPLAAVRRLLQPG
jgi:hypothetical protein